MNDAIEPTTDDATVDPLPISDAEESSSNEGAFSADYVGKLRQEAAEGRVKAKRADALAAQVVSAIVQGDGRLIDAADLAFSNDFLNDDGVIDESKVKAAIDALLERKPYLAARRPSSPLPQGVMAESERVSLAALLRQRA